MVAFIEKESEPCKRCESTGGLKLKLWDAPWRSADGLCVACDIVTTREEVHLETYGSTLTESKRPEAVQKPQIRHQGDAKPSDVESHQNAAAIAVNDYERAWKRIYGRQAVPPLENEPDDGIDLPDRKPCIDCGTRKGKPARSGGVRARDRGRCKNCSSRYYEAIGRKGVVA